MASLSASRSFSRCVLSLRVCFRMSLWASKSNLCERRAADRCCMSCHVACVIQGCLGKDVVVGMWSLLVAACRLCHCSCGCDWSGSCGRGSE